MVQTPYFAANQLVLREFSGLALQKRGFGLQTPCSAQTLSFLGGLEGVGSRVEIATGIAMIRITSISDRWRV